MFTVIVNSSGLSLLFTCGTDDRHGMVVPMCLCFCAEKYWLAPRLPHPRFRAHAACNSNRRIQGRALTQQFRVRQRRKDMQGCIVTVHVELAGWFS